ncbi:MAG: hypothetical protein B7733_21600 [Myxococcales bacterium FL481]|nr:MAG: hypothetical protein B7733_21600 [Myxococcales bacterium FL481]
MTRLLVTHATVTAVMHAAFSVAVPERSPVHHLLPIILVAFVVSCTVPGETAGQPAITAELTSRTILKDLPRCQDDRFHSTYSEVCWPANPDRTMTALPLATPTPDSLDDRVSTSGIQRVVELARVDDLGEGWVGFRVYHHSGEYILYLGSPNMPVDVLDENGVSVLNGCSRYLGTETFDDLRATCTGRELLGAYTMWLEPGIYRIEFGPIDRTHVRVAVEKRRDLKSAATDDDWPCRFSELPTLVEACPEGETSTPVTMVEYGTPNPPMIDVGSTYGFHLTSSTGSTGTNEGVVQFVPPYTSEYAVYVGTAGMPVSIWDEEGGHERRFDCSLKLRSDLPSWSPVESCAPFRGAYVYPRLEGGRIYNLEFGPVTPQRWVRAAIYANDTDRDGDGLADSFDKCPDDPNKTEPGTCGCGVAGPDLDGDGLCGDADACPFDESNDADGDGVCGDVDNCPADANLDQADEDDNGRGDVCEFVTSGEWSYPRADLGRTAYLASSGELDHDTVGRLTPIWESPVGGEFAVLAGDRLFVGDSEYSPVLSQPLDPATGASLDAAQLFPVAPFRSWRQSWLETDFFLEDVNGQEVAKFVCPDSVNCGVFAADNYLFWRFEDRAFRSTIDWHNMDTGARISSIGHDHADPLEFSAPSAPFAVPISDGMVYSVARPSISIPNENGNDSFVRATELIGASLDGTREGFRTEYFVDIPATAPAGGAVAANGRVYTTSRGVEAFDAHTGEMLWQQDTLQRQGLFVASPSTVYQVVGGFNQPISVLALDAATGAERFEQPLPYSAASWMAGVANLILVTQGSHLVALDATTGALVGDRDLGFDLEAVAIDSGVVYAVGTDRTVGLGL